MSSQAIARFPHHSLPLGPDHNPEAAEAARQRIATLPDPYVAHAAPRKEELAGKLQPVSPAAQAVQGARDMTAMPVTVRHAAEPLALPGKTKREERVTARLARMHTAVAPAASSPTPAAAAATAMPLPSPPIVETKPAAKTEPIPEPRPAETAETKKPAAKRGLPSRLRPLLVGVLTFVGLFLVFKAPIFLSQISYATQQQQSATPADNQAAATVPPAPIITIPKINVNAPVVYATDNNENDILTDLQSGVVHYAGTAVPGQPGNSVIFGHSSNDWWEAGNYKFVFVLLDKLQAGDTFTVNYQSHQYIYQVTGSKVVEPTDLSVLNPTPDPEMTLITCTPPGTSWKRLVVTAKQISPSPNSAKTPAGSGAAAAGGGTLPGNSPSLTQQIGDWWQSVVQFFGGKPQNQNSGSQNNQAPSSSSGASTLPAVK